MKKILSLVLVLAFVFSALAPSVYAKTDDKIPILVEDPDPFGLGFTEEGDDPYIELSDLECMHQGLIRTNGNISAEDLYLSLQVVDESDNKFETQKLFYVLDLILYNYYDSLTADELYNAFISKTRYIDINNMAATYEVLFSVLDKFSYHLTPDEADAFFSPTDARGVGISTSWQEAKGERPAGMYVNAVAVGSSAEKEGVKNGDRLIKINSVDVSGLGYNAVSTVLTEESRDKDYMTYTFERYGEGEYTFILERTDVTFPEYSIEFYPEKNVFCLEIDSFMNDSTATEVSALIDVAWQLGYRDVIVDLQNNPGGSVDVAAKIASKFTPNALELLFYMGREDGNAPFFSSGNGYAFDSVTVLVNENSVSSAEILAYTLRNIASAKIVGQTTYGKGVAQVATRFIDGSAVGITAYVAYGADGTTYNEIGVIPDVKRLPKAEKNSLSVDTPAFTVLDIEDAFLGEENTAVLALEKRLVALQYISPDEADGIFDDDTALALKYLQMNYSLDPSGVLDESTFDLIVELIKAWEMGYSVEETLLDYVLEAR